VSDVDLVVLGGGPAGIYAAFRACDLGAEVALVEPEGLGGTCLLRGCVPTVAALEQARRARDTAMRSGRLSEIDWTAWAAGRDNLTERVQRGLERAVATSRIRRLRGRGRLVGPGVVQVAEDSQRHETVSTKAVVLATGSRLTLPPIPGIDAPGVWTTDHALGMQDLPERVAVLGSSFIAVEWAQFFRSLGTAVVLVAGAPTLLPGEDAVVQEAVATLLAEQGVDVRLGWQPARIRTEGHGLVLEGPTESVTAERLVVGDGRRPAGDDWAYAGIRVRADGSVPTDPFLRTDRADVWAAGDLVGGRMLANWARAEGEAAAEAALGTGGPFDGTAVPRVYHLEPEVAAVGLSESEAREAGHDPVVGVADLGQNPRALMMGQERGFVKLVASRRSGRLLGAHLVGPGASEAVGEVALALRLEALAEDLAAVVRGHPTVFEAIGEAAREVVRAL